MRLATPLAVAVLSIASLGLTAPAHSQGAPPTTAFGLQCTPLGNSVLDFDAATRKLIVTNIGSSGQDGVEIQLGAGANGVIISGPIAGSPTDDCSLGIGRSATGAPLSFALDAHVNPDGSMHLEPDFSDVGATGCWILLLDDAGNLIKRVYKPLPVSVHVSASAPFSRTAWAVGMGKGFNEWAKASFSRKVLVNLDGGAAGGIECDDVLFGVVGETGGEPFASMTGAGLMYAVASPPGQFEVPSIAVIVPPCAGCPNGPNDDDALIAEGGAVWVFDAATSPVAISNIGSSGQDGVSTYECIVGSLSTCIRESPTKTTMGIVVDEQPLAPGVLVCSAAGKVGGTRQSLGQMNCFVGLGQSEFEPDFSAVGSMGYRIVLYSQGAVVADVTNPLTRASHQKPQTQWLVQADQIGGNGPVEFRIICITSPCPGWTVTLEGVVYTVDEIVFQPVGPGVVSPSGISGMALHAAIDPPSGLLSTTASLPIYGVTSSPAQPVLEAPRPGRADFAEAIASPNPASGPMRLAFTLPREGQVDVAVIDASGRRVRTLASAKFAAGAHELTWDGRDDRGAATAPGIYFLRVESGGTTRVSRVSRLW